MKKKIIISLIVLGSQLFGSTLHCHVCGDSFVKQKSDFTCIEFIASSRNEVYDLAYKEYKKSATKWEAYQGDFHDGNVNQKHSIMADDGYDAYTVHINDISSSNSKIKNRFKFETSLASGFSLDLKLYRDKKTRVKIGKEMIQKGYFPENAPEYWGWFDLLGKGSVRQGRISRKFYAICMSN